MLCVYWCHYHSACKSFDFAEIYDIICYHNLLSVRLGRGASPVGALPPYPQQLLLCSLTHFEYPVQQSVLVTLLAEFSKCICIFPAVETSDNIGVEAIAIILDN